MYSNKLTNCDFLLLNGPSLWASAPSYTLAVCHEYLSSIGFNSVPLDLNFLLYSKFTKHKKQWTALTYKQQHEMFQFIKKDKSWEPFWNDIKSLNPKYIGLTFNSSNERFLENLFYHLHSLCPNSNFIAGGPSIFYHSLYDFKFFPKDLYNSIDTFFVGNIENFNFKSFDKIIAPKTTLKNTLPFFDTFNLSQYPRKDHLPLMLSKGCTHRCSFCSECLLSDIYVNPNLKRSIEHIETLYKQGIKWFTFFDSIFNADLDFLNDFCDQLIKRNINIKWEAQCSINNNISVELLTKMKKSGCFNIFIGLESASDKILKLMKKPFTKDSALLFLEKCNSARLHFELSFIVGFPGEDESDFWETIYFVENNASIITKIAQVNAFYYYPGAAISKSIDTSTLYKAYHKAEVINSRLKLLISAAKKHNIPITDHYIENLNISNNTFYNLS